MLLRLGRIWPPSSSSCSFPSASGLSACSRIWTSSWPSTLTSLLLAAPSRMCVGPRTNPPGNLLRLEETLPEASYRCVCSAQTSASAPSSPHRQPPTLLARYAAARRESSASRRVLRAKRRRRWLVEVMPQSVPGGGRQRTYLGVRTRCPCRTL